MKFNIAVYKIPLKKFSNIDAKKLESNALDLEKLDSFATNNNLYTNDRIIALFDSDGIALEYLNQLDEKGYPTQKHPYFYEMKTLKEPIEIR